jgi:hypothetical protein
VSNVTRHSLARISLRWMIRECFKTNTGIMFNAHALRDTGLDPTTLFPFVTPRPPPLPLGSLTVEKLKVPSRLGRIISRFKRNSISDASSSTSSPTTYKGDIRTEEEEELYDALSPIYDQLCLKRSWWLLEVIPLNLRYQRGDNQWVSYIGRVLCILTFDDHPSDLAWKIGLTAHVQGSYQSSAPMVSRYTDLLSYAWRPNILLRGTRNTCQKQNFLWNRLGSISPQAFVGLYPRC